MDPSSVELVVTTSYALATNPQTGMLELTTTSTNVELRPKTETTPATSPRARRIPTPA